MEICITFSGDRDAVNIFEASDMEDAYAKCRSFCAKYGLVTANTLIYAETYTNLPEERLLFNHITGQMFIDIAWAKPGSKNPHAGGVFAPVAYNDLPDWARKQGGDDVGLYEVGKP